MSITTMKVSEAVEYEGSFDAVMDGIATDAQCTEVIAVAKVVAAYLQDAVSRAQAIPSRRDSYLDMVSEEKRTAILAVAGKGTGKPRLELDEFGRAAPPP